MSELGRPFGLTFEDRDEPAPLPVVPIAPAAPAVPDVGRPFDMNFGEGTQNGGPADAPSAATPPAAPEPVATVDGVATPPAAPQAAPTAGEAGAITAAEMERERRLVQSKAEYDSYLQKVMYAAGKMATDDGRAALIHDIIRHKGLNTVEGYDQVDRNFLADSRDHYARLAAQRAQRDRELRRDSDDISRAFGIAPEDFVPGFDAGKDLAGRKRAADDYHNDYRDAQLSLTEKMDNRHKRSQLTERSSEAIRRLMALERLKAKIAEVDMKDRAKEGLSPDERSVLQSAPLMPDFIARETQKAFKELIESQAELARRPQSRALRKLGKAETVGEFLEVLIENPVQIAALKLTDAVPALAAGKIGTALAGPIGGALAAAYVTFGKEYAEAVVKGFEDEGIDLRNADAVKEAINNPQKMRKVFNNALATAGIATTADIAAGVIGGKRITSVQSQIFGGLTERVAQTGAQAVVGAAKEKITGLAVGEKPSKGEILEGVLDGALNSILP